MKSFKHRAIRSQFFLLAISAVIIIIGIIILSYYNSTQGIKKTNSNDIMAFSVSIQQSINSKCDTYNKLLSLLAFNSTVQEFITESDRARWLELSKEVDNLFSNTQFIEAGILDIILVDNAGNSYGLKNSFRTTGFEAIKKLTDTKNNYYSDIVSLEYNHVHYNCIILSTNIYSINPKIGSKVIGKVGLILDVASIGIDEAIIDQISIAEVYIMDRSGNIYSYTHSDNNIALEDVMRFCKKEDVSFTEKINSKNYLIYNYPINQTGGKIMCFVKEDKLLDSVSRSRNMSISLVSISIILLSIPFSMVINNIVNPLNKLVKYMANIKKGRIDALKSRITVQGCEEINILVSEFNTMISEIDDLTQEIIHKKRQIYEADLSKKQSELAFLQSQINPHFLYNTFDSIKGLATIKGVPEIRQMTGNLSTIFRYSVKTGDMVSLSEELGITRKYIEIQELRFPDRFEVIYEIQEGIEALYILKMLIQPVIENAIYHGLEMKEERGVLRIEAYINTEGHLLIKVSDNGVGIDSDQLKELTDKLNEDSSTIDRVKANGYSTEVGLSNVNDRIKFSFGAEFGIFINSVKGEGTDITLKMPVVKSI